MKVTGLLNLWRNHFLVKKKIRKKILHSTNNFIGSSVTQNVMFFVAFFNCYLSKSSFSRNSDKFPFNQSCRLTCIMTVFVGHAYIQAETLVNANS